MSFLEHIRTCNSFDLGGMRPFRVAGKKVGWVSSELCAGLADFPDVFIVRDDAVDLSPGLADFDARSAGVEAVLESLCEQGLVARRRGERYAVAENLGAEPLMWIDRGAATEFGVLNTGFHLNGIVQDGEDLKMWVATRALDKTTYPVALDNMVAGGQPHGISAAENLLKECWEEAGIEADLASRAVSVGIGSYAMSIPAGLRRHVMYFYDLELLADFTPRPIDGEVHAFELMPIQEVAEIVRSSDRFKYNCNLAIIDFLIRHGMIEPDDPDYAALCVGLRSPQP